MGTWTATLKHRGHCVGAERFELSTSRTRTVGLGFRVNVYMAGVLQGAVDTLSKAIRVHLHTFITVYTSYLELHVFDRTGAAVCRFNIHLGDGEVVFDHI